MRQSLILLALLFCTTPHARAEPYLRIDEDHDTGRVSLQIASRTFRRGPTEPVITLVGVAHVGDTAYYDALQAHLDAHDLVLYEGVGPIWAGLDDDATPADRVNTTRERIRALGLAIKARSNAGVETHTLDDLLGGAGYGTKLLAAASRDGWGRPIRYRVGDDGFGLASLGADGRPGGDGADADIALTDLPPLLDSELESSEGIQAQLAGAAGLVFQLDAIQYDKPSWRNSDTTAEALSYAMAGLDPDDARPGDGSPGTGGGDPLFDLMRGEGVMGKLAGGLLKLLGSSPRSSALLRLMLIETLARADDLMGVAGGVEGLDHMMEVLLAQRNEVVLDDIRAEIKAREGADDPGRIAVFYGAGHLSEMETAMRVMGYQPIDTAWFDAIEIDPDKVGVSRRQISGMRSMIGSMLEAQTGAIKNRTTPGD